MGRARPREALAKRWGQRLQGERRHSRLPRSRTAGWPRAFVGFRCSRKGLVGEIAIELKKVEARVGAYRAPKLDDVTTLRRAELSKQRYVVV